MKKGLLIILLAFYSFGFAQDKTEKQPNQNIVFAIYPNPVHQVFHINTNDTVVSVTIYNVLGKQVAQFHEQDQYNISALKRGIYLLHLETESGVAVRKLVVR